MKGFICLILIPVAEAALIAEVYKWPVCLGILCIHLFSHVFTTDNGETIRMSYISGINHCYVLSYTALYFIVFGTLTHCWSTWADVMLACFHSFHVILSTTITNASTAAAWIRRRRRRRRLPGMAVGSGVSSTLGGGWLGWIDSERVGHRDGGSAAKRVHSTNSVDGGWCSLQVVLGYINVASIKWAEIYFTGVPCSPVRMIKSIKTMSRFYIRYDCIA